MKTLFASTAIAVCLGLPALAQTVVDSPFVGSIDTQALRASDLMGARLYVTEVEADPFGGLQDDWNDVGEISDIIVGASGGIDAVLADIGGFLGLGERTVAVNMDDLQFVSDGAEADEYFIVLQGTQAQLEAAPEFDDSFERGRLGLERVDAPAATVDGTIVAGTTTAMSAAPMIEREGYALIERDALTADDVTGATVYGVGDDIIGEIGDLIMSDGGQVDRAIVDVGGFLGLGEKHVELPFDSLSVMRGDGDVRVYIDATQEQLEALPEYEG
ncbi:PRC-barrel domain-containing protein [Jannaschia rubra]|uniref:PRC-barrel domain protein n=1 Tax=Jannaschia rubra TaxID=282197 RepID=A0A0M6XLS4_9RHOB|nr:PRC-barrel domain-containing protein [Jannaschia rubra]CTQ32039.1 PRC-barrel domain protein [Jannaschia rubra]SFG39163.1 PRC-barrel domain-containing protein [Jannaschia rubra]